MLSSALTPMNLVTLFKKLGLVILFLLPAYIFAQTKVVSGTVKDSSGNPLQGVSVKVKNKKGGTQTDAFGSYSINIDGSSTLIFSYVGYEDYEVNAANQTGYNITLHQQSGSLNDVVVVGYGTQRKADVTGAVSTVNTKLMQNRPITNSVDALQGAAPGLVVTRNNGQPGQEGWNLNVRGLASLNGINQPLVIIDGVEGDLINLNPNDIESISILKDAAAAIYGAKSSGGVIVVTTKKGNNKLRLSYDNLFTFKDAYGIPKRVPAWRDAELRNIANQNAGGAPAYSDRVIGWLKGNDSNFVYNLTGVNASLNGFYYSVDPISAVIRKSSPSQNHNLTVSGGNNQTQYLLSFGAYNEDGIFRYGPDNYRRYNARFNVTTKFNKFFSLDSRIAYTQGRTSSSSASVNGDYGLLYNVYQLRAYYPTTFPGHPDLLTNPTANILQNGGYNNLRQNMFDGTFTFKAENLVRGLTLRAIYSPHFTQANTTVFTQTYANWGWDTLGNPVISGYGNNPNSLTKRRLTITSHDIQALADYGFALANEHHFHVLAGFQFDQYNYDYLNVGQGSLLTNLPTLNYRANPTVYPSASDDIENNSWVSVFGRLSYNYKEKYYLEATLRNDASSRLAPGHRNQTFPGASIAWRIGQENWFKAALPFFNEFKLRGSYGKLGNAQLGNLWQRNYDYVNQIVTGSSYPFNNTANASLYQAALPSQNLGWETIETYDGGVDVALLNNRLTGSFDYFIRKNNDMLIVVNQPAVLGVTPSTTNGAAMKGWGWETTIGWRDHVGKVNYWINVNVDDNQNKITRYDGNIVVNAGVNTAITGYPVNSVFGYKDEGYFSAADGVTKHAFQDNRTGPGDIMYKDINGDNKITTGSNTLQDHGDLIYLGNTSPRYNFGVTLGAQWKGFDLSAFFQGVGKRNMYIYGYSIIPYIQTWRSAWEINEDYWTPENTDAKFPRLYTGGTQNTVVSSHWVQNAAYIRLKNLQVGYTLPASFTAKAKIQSARIFFSGQDIWTSTRMWYKYYDPENPNNASFNYPLFRSYAVGLNVTF